MVSHGAAIKIADTDLQRELLPVITDLLKDKEKLVQMGQRAQALSRPEAAHQIASELRSLANVSS
jgi:UDP-N-acetylglucosamine:LPS N-acetylglucosamine transferase